MIFSSKPAKRFCPFGYQQTIETPAAILGDFDLHRSVFPHGLLAMPVAMVLDLFWRLALAYPR